MMSSTYICEIYTYMMYRYTYKCIHIYKCTSNIYLNIYIVMYGIARLFSFVSPMMHAMRVTSNHNPEGLLDSARLTAICLIDLSYHTHACMRFPKIRCS